MRHNYKRRKVLKHANVNVGKLTETVERHFELECGHTRITLVNRFKRVPLTIGCPHCA